MNFHFLFLSVVLEGEEIEKEHCLLEFMKGKGVKLDPISTLCWVNGVAISQATKLNQGKECFTKLSTCFSERFSLSISNLWIHDKSRRTRKYCLYSCKRPLRRSSHWWSQARKSAGKRVAGVKRGKTDDRQVLPSAGIHAICFKSGKKLTKRLKNRVIHFLIGCFCASGGWVWLSLFAGDVIVLGKSDVFKFNYPTEAAILREKRRSGLYGMVSFCSRWNTVFLLHIKKKRV